MNLSVRITSLWALMLLASCSGLQTNETTLLDRVVIIQAHDLIAQTKSGNGEGLAKPVPGQPLLINNQLVFSAMSDAVLGIAMAVGTIKQTVELFEGMVPLSMEDWLKAELKNQSDSTEWQALLSRLEQEDKQLILEPYCMLNGHPSAVLEVRIRAKIMQGESETWTKEFVEKSERLPLEGEGSWSFNHAKTTSSTAQNAIPALIQKLKTI